jgi:hypothetical protein
VTGAALAMVMAIAMIRIATTFFVGFILEFESIKSKIFGIAVGDDEKRISFYISSRY